MAERSKTCPPTATLAVVRASPRFVGAADARIEYGSLGA